MTDIKTFLSNFTLIYSHNILIDTNIPHHKHITNYIYLISNETNYFYVGQTINIIQRIKAHNIKNTCFISSPHTQIYLLETIQNNETTNVLEKLWIYWFQDNNLKLTNKQIYQEFRFYPKEYILSIDSNYNKFINKNYMLRCNNIICYNIYYKLRDTIFYSYDINQLIYLFNKYPKAYKDFVSSTTYNKRYYMTELAKQMKKMKLKSKC